MTLRDATPRVQPSPTSRPSPAVHGGAREATESNTFMASRDHVQEQDEIVSLDIALPAHCALERVPEVLGSPSAPWLGEPVASPTPGVRQFACDLELQVSPEGRATFRKSAIIGLGEPKRDGDAWVVEIQWRAGTLAPLFPVFAGSLRLETDAVALSGHYAPPGGKVGYMLDRALLHIAARRTAGWFVRRVAAAIR